MSLIEELRGIEDSAFCERGNCKISRASPLCDKRMQYTCSVCLALYSVWQTALGPAWQRVKTLAPASGLLQ